MILKEQKQKEEQEEKDKEKKKKKKKQEAVKITKFMIKIRLLRHFQNHIGKEARTSQEEIFQAVTGVNSQAVNSFARFYFWKSIEETIRRLRRTNECFIIKEKNHFFVLKEQSEADYFRKICERAIEGMNKAELRADDWVEKEKWKKFAKMDYSDEEEPPKPTPTSDKIIDDKTDKARRIVKLWKEENEN